MSLFDYAVNIKTGAKKIAASNKYNKIEFSKNYQTHPEIIEFKKLFVDKSFVDKVITSMPEKSFCNIVEVKDCEPAKGKCTCTKVMVFGEDEINGKRCEQFTVRLTSSRCTQKKLDLSEQCKASIVSVSCDEEIMFEPYETPEFIRKRLDELHDMYDALGHKWNP